MGSYAVWWRRGLVFAVIYLVESKGREALDMEEPSYVQEPIIDYYVNPYGLYYIKNYSIDVVSRAVGYMGKHGKIFAIRTLSIWVKLDIIELLRKGYSISFIAREYGVDRRIVEAIAEFYNIKARKKNRPKGIISRRVLNQLNIILNEYYRPNTNVEELARRLGINKSSLIMRIRRLSIPTRRELHHVLINYLYYYQKIPKYKIRDILGIGKLKLKRATKEKLPLEYIVRVIRNLGKTINEIYRMSFGLSLDEILEMAGKRRKR